MEIRRFYDSLISTMGFPMLVRWHLYIESAPAGILLSWSSHRNSFNDWLYIGEINFLWEKSISFKFPRFSLCVQLRINEHRLSSWLGPKYVPSSYLNQRWHSSMIYRPQWLKWFHQYIGWYHIWSFICNQETKKQNTSTPFTHIYMISIHPEYHFVSALT